MGIVRKYINDASPNDNGQIHTNDNTNRTAVAISSVVPYPPDRQSLHTRIEKGSCLWGGVFGAWMRRVVVVMSSLISMRCYSEFFYSVFGIGFA